MLRERETSHTTKGDSGGGDNAGLDNSVFLSGEGQPQEARLAQELGPSLDEEEAQETSRDIKGRYNTCGEVEFHHYEAEQYAQHKAHHKGSHCQLLPP